MRESLLSYIALQQQANQAKLAIHDRSLEAATRNEGGGGVEHNQKRTGSALLSINSVGYFSVIAIACFLSLLFMIVFVYVQPRDETSLGSNKSRGGGDETNLSNEAKQLLGNRLYLVKRYIPYHFDDGLPCPEKNDSKSALAAGISSSSGSLSNIVNSPITVHNHNQ